MRMLWRHNKARMYCTC